MHIKDLHNTRIMSAIYIKHFFPFVSSATQKSLQTDLYNFLSNFQPNPIGPWSMANPNLGLTYSDRKIGPIHFEIYWRQTEKQTNRGENITSWRR